MRGGSGRRDATFDRAMKRLFMTGWSLTPEAADLLRARFGRRRARLWCLPLFAAAVVLIAAVFWSAGADGWPHAGWGIGAVVVVSAAFAIRFELIFRSELRLGQSLPRRWGRTEHVTTGLIFGRILIVAVCGVVAEAHGSTARDRCRSDQPGC